MASLGPDLKALSDPVQAALLRAAKRKMKCEKKAPETEANAELEGHRGFGIRYLCILVLGY